MANTQSFSASTDNATVSGTLTDKELQTPEAPPSGRVAIGPRVTFNFITDEWSSANTYAYYDVVQVNGNSYIARQNVPTGIEITNTDYWIHWADPNAQFQELYNIVMTFQDKIASIEESIDTLKTGNTYNDIASNGFIYKG